jgi:hypothetical protein
MLKTIIIGHMRVTLSAAKERPVFKRERQVLRHKFLHSIPHRLRMTMGYWTVSRMHIQRPGYRQAMAA